MLDAPACLNAPAVLKHLILPVPAANCSLSTPHRVPPHYPRYWGTRRLSHVPTYSHACALALTHTRMPAQKRTYARARAHALYKRAPGARRGRSPEGRPAGWAGGRRGARPAGAASHCPAAPSGRSTPPCGWRGRGCPCWCKGRARWRAAPAPPSCAPAPPGTAPPAAASPHLRAWVGVLCGNGARVSKGLWLLRASRELWLLRNVGRSEIVVMTGCWASSSRWGWLSASSSM